MALERVQILLNHKQREKLKELAQARGESVSEITRLAIDAGLEQLTQDEHQGQMRATLEAARQLRQSMALLTIDVTEDIQKMRQEHDG